MPLEGLGHPQAEHHETAERTRFFNVGAMSDDQIIVIYRGLGQALQPEGWDGLHKAGVGDQEATADSLFEGLALDMRDHAAQDPERVKAFVQRCLATNQEIDAEFAVSVLPGLIDYDYDFTRDAMVDLELNGWHLEGPSYSALPESIDNEISRLMRDRLTYEQREDFNAKITALGGIAIEAALPGQ